MRAVAVCTALLATGCLTAPPSASADVNPATFTGCSQVGPTLRYLVLFDQGTSEQTADSEIAAACGTTASYYPQISVAVATSPDPSFVTRIGPDRAYSAAGEAYSDADDSPGATKKPDETGSGATAATSQPGVVPTANRTGDQWDMTMINADRAHKITEGSSQVLVGVLDSGIDPQHPGLLKALDTADSAGCVTGAPDTSEAAWEPTTSAHGTHVAGTIAAADDGQGTAGVAPGVRVASVKVVNDDGYIYPEAAVCGFMWAAERGMTITNSSYFVDPWIFTCRDAVGQQVIYEAVRRAVDYAAGRGVLNVAAAGNQAMDLTNPGSDNGSPDNVSTNDQRSRPLTEQCAELPAGLRGVVTVSSVGADETKASYSSYGLGAIDVTAPGGDTRQQAPDGQSCVLSTVPDGYASSCGTSMAAPHVAGVLALLASAHPQDSAKQLTQLLYDEAQPMPCPADYDLTGTGVQDAYCTGDSSYNSFYGHGLVDALAAVTDGVNGTSVNLASSAGGGNSAELGANTAAGNGNPAGSGANASAGNKKSTGLLDPLLSVLSPAPVVPLDPLGLW
ncbi:MAG TPA: S8 family serine peptidase [Pseudonocardiaceae bacterium]|jgi:subtilisin family serine protease|nr:S8 family serine peptidase [Pseudonocardiaceae bacterium]